MAEGVIWVNVQIFHLVVEKVGVVVTHSLVIALVHIVLGMNVLKNLDLPCVLSWVEQLDCPERGCGLRAAWLNVTKALRPTGGQTAD